MIPTADGRCAISTDGRYSVGMHAKQLGFTFQISFEDEHVLSVWARVNHRKALPSERTEVENDVVVEEWVVDNGAGSGLANLITLSDPVGDRTLGELLLGFLQSRKLAMVSAGAAARSFLKLSCRGNQKRLMYDIAGR